MTPARCPVCGAPGGTCGDTPLTKPVITSLNERNPSMADTKVYLPKQNVKRGKAGYKGKDVIVVDANGKQEAAPTTTKKK